MIYVLAFLLFPPIILFFIPWGGWLIILLVVGAAVALTLGMAAVEGTWRGLCWLVPDETLLNRLMGFGCLALLVLAFVVLAAVEHRL
jgi:hypothetical protein